MLVGYARTSTLEQIAGIEAQLRDLTAAGCERIWREHVSSVAERPELAKLLDFVREGDVVIVTKLDRMARSLPDLWALIERLQAKGVALRILALGLDTGTATGRLMLSVVGAIAQFEREMMLERQREGIAVAKAAGKYKGRKPTVKMQAGEIRRLHSEGLSNGAIARQLGVHRSNVGRVLKAAAAGGDDKGQQADG
jgi:DNA invertase Pin-like site-specific DNA recombinase